MASHLSDTKDQKDIEPEISAIKHQAKGQARGSVQNHNSCSGDNNLKDCATQFHHAMIGVANFAHQHKFGIRFHQMINEFGAIETAKRLLSTREIQTGLIRLWELNSVDKSMEALVIDEKFKCLFSALEIEEARRRLGELGYSANS